MVSAQADAVEVMEGEAGVVLRGGVQGLEATLVSTKILPQILLMLRFLVKVRRLGLILFQMRGIRCNLRKIKKKNLILLLGWVNNKFLRLIVESRLTGMSKLEVLSKGVLGGICLVKTMSATSVRKLVTWLGIVCVWGGGQCS
jgi:hypothetical protein